MSERRRRVGTGTPGRLTSRPVAGLYGSELLYQIIEVISSGPDLSTILHRFIPVVTTATECHGCFIYFIEESGFVLRSASAAYVHLEGKVRFGLDEGLAGWVARTRRSAFIKDRALEDPRVVYVPELEEEQYQSLVAVPIVGRTAAAIGVITLDARAPHEFRPQDLDFLEHAAALIAGAIENARLYDEAVGRVKQLTQLSDVAQRVGAAPTMDALLEAVADGCRTLLGASRCEIYLSRPDAQLELALAGSAAPPVLDARRLWSRAVAADETGESGRGLAELVWGTRHEGAPLFAVLSTGDDRIGLLCVLVDRASDDGRSLLASIAAYAAVAIQRRQLIGSLEEKNLVKDFFEGLSVGPAEAPALREQAARLGCDLDAQHLVMQAVPWAAPSGSRERGAKTNARPQPEWRDLTQRIESRLRVELPRSIFDVREGLMRGLLRVPPTGPETVVEAVRRTYESVAGGAHVGLAIGLSNRCEGPAALLRGFAEAASAAQVGSLLRSAPGVYAYEELGAYRYVINAEGGIRDRYHERLDRLVEYQKRRGTDLLRTLEAYVENHGSIGRTSAALFMHTNTLRQRLARIEKLTNLDLEKEDWLSLGMAIKLVKLGQIRGLKTTGLPDARRS